MNNIDNKNRHKYDEILVHEGITYEGITPLCLHKSSTAFHACVRVLPPKAVCL